MVGRTCPCLPATGHGAYLRLATVPTRSWPWCLPATSHSWPRQSGRVWLWLAPIVVTAHDVRGCMTLEATTAPNGCCCPHDSSSSYPDDHRDRRPCLRRVIQKVRYPPLHLSDSLKMDSFARQWFSVNELRERMRACLLLRGWDLESSSIELDERNVVDILNDLFDASSDAALAFYFFGLSKRCNGRKHGILAVSTMVHIAVLGNMNHIAVTLLMRTVSDSEDHCSDDMQKLLFDSLRETSRSREVLEIVYSMLVKCYADKKMTKVMVKSVEDMRNLGLFLPMEVYNSLIRVLLEFKDFNLAWEVFTNIPSRFIGTKRSILSLFISELAVHSHFECAYKLLFEMQKYCGQADVAVYTIVIHSLCKWGFLKEATVLFHKMLQLGIPHDNVLVNSIIEGYRKAGRLVEADHLLNYLNGAPDVFLYNSFLMECCRNGNMAKALKLFNQMFQVGLAPDCSNYTTIICGFCKVCNLEHASMIFALMLKRGIKPTIMTYTTLLEGYCRKHDLPGAETILSLMKMEGIQPDVVAYNTLINGYSNYGHMQKACELKDRMEKDGVTADLATYNLILHGLVETGAIMQSREIFKELVRRGLTPNRITYTNLIAGCSRDGNLEEAFLIWSSMNNNGIKPDVVTCSALLKCFCKRRLMFDANALFHKMLDAGLEPDLRLYNMLICGFCKEGNIREARSLLAMMKANDIFPNYKTMEVLVCCLQKIGTKSAAESVAMELVKSIFGS
ncbi:hypothetical protein ZIOFF_062858 [Zingiber officinale]|uniref:Pentatricopeptide repeat-containing protein n=1 Tax=Zingiber officinale TaxID=94328 RepID=A0A8J5K9H9_ZINOF|nr:hypothetical protein ZIOFF_062858 [Zingiber officinale]